MSMRYFLFVMVAVLYAACSSESGNNEGVSAVDSTSADSMVQTPPRPAPLHQPDSFEQVHKEVRGRVVAVISRLKEYREAKAYIDSLYDQKRSIRNILESPEGDATEYTVRIGFDGEDRFETYYVFYVDRNTFDIRAEDLATGEILPYYKWRRKYRNEKPYSP